MSAGVDPCRGLATKRLERDHAVTVPEQPPATGLDERPHQRPVLVERRPVARAVLLEHELDLGALLDLAAEEGERAEAEAAQGGVEVRCAHAPGYVPPGPSPSLALGTPIGDPVRIALAARLDRSAAPRAGPADLPVHGPLPEARVERARASAGPPLRASSAAPRPRRLRASAKARSAPATAPRPARGCRSPPRAAGRGAPRRSQSAGRRCGTCSP